MILILYSPEMIEMKMERFHKKTIERIVDIIEFCLQQTHIKTVLSLYEQYNRMSKKL